MGFPAQLPSTAAKPQQGQAAVRAAVQSAQQAAEKRPAHSADFAIKNIAALAQSTAQNGKKAFESAPKLVYRSPAGGITGEAALRQRMVARLMADGVTDARVLSAFAQVERHLFIDTALSAQAYEDTSLPIGLLQTISKPSVVARMLALALDAPLMQGLSPGSRMPGRLLEVGTGCGYQAALMALLAQEVYSIERLRGLHEKARENLRTFRLTNTHLLLGDGMLGYAKGAPYAAIVAAAGGEAVPQAWIDQLAVGGRIVAPVHGSGGAQLLTVVDKSPSGVQMHTLETVQFVPLKSGVI